MNDLIIEGTENSPYIQFNVDGNLQIKGRAIPDNAIIMFEPLQTWIKDLKANSVLFDINLEYLNTSASMQLFSLLQDLDNNNDFKEVKVVWHYEVDDEDHYDTGLTYEEKLDRIVFEYKMEP